MSEKNYLYASREIEYTEKNVISAVAKIHVKTFVGFFLTFMGEGFLRVMYSCFCTHPESGLLVCFDGENPIGFAAYSRNYSGLFRYMIKTNLIRFALYSVGAFFRRPKAFLHIVGAFLKPEETKRDEKYVELSSIGTLPEYKGRGVGSLLISEVKKKVDYDTYDYLTLETDAENNESTIAFYEKNGFVRAREYKTSEGRAMIEFRYAEAKKEKESAAVI